MGLSVSKIGYGNMPVVKNIQADKTSASKPEAPSCPINLNNNPASVNFKGFFFSNPQKPAKTEEGPKYGPFQVSRGATYLNNEDAEYIVSIIGGYIDNAYNVETDSDALLKNRVDDEVIESLKEPFFSLMCYYQKSETSFPRFYDSIARAVPKACAEEDLKHKNDNCTRLYENALKDIVKFGKEFEPGTDDPFCSGVKYLYQTVDFRPFKMPETVDYMEDILEEFKNGKMPELADLKYAAVYPRWHQSTVKDESEYFKNTKPPTEKFEHASTYILEHPHGTDVNENIYHRPEIVVPERAVYDPWWGNP